MKRQVNPELKQAVVTLLKAGISVDLGADACVIADSDGHFIVQYFPSDETGRAGGLDECHAKMMDEDDEMDEYFDTPEEAADLFLRIKEEYETT